MTSLPSRSAVSMMTFGLCGGCLNGSPTCTPQIRFGRCVPCFSACIFNSCLDPWNLPSQNPVMNATAGCNVECLAALIETRADVNHHVHGTAVSCQALNLQTAVFGMSGNSEVSVLFVLRQVSREEAKTPGT